MQNYGAIQRHDSVRVGTPVARSSSRAILILASCVFAATVVTLSIDFSGSFQRTALDEADTPFQPQYPPAVLDLDNLKNLDDSQSWMGSVVDNANNLKLLHPWSDIDPFTHLPLSPDTDYESHLRALHTKSIVSIIQKAAVAEMEDAQKSARDATGVDTGCTYDLQNQTDYVGTVSQTALGIPCVSWPGFNTSGAVANGTTAANGSQTLTNTHNYCRNPGGLKEGAWCYIKEPLSDDVEGVDWEYCDVGLRCNVDVPMLVQLREAQDATRRRLRQKGGGRLQLTLLSAVEKQNALALAQTLPHRARPDSLPVSLDPDYDLDGSARR